MHRIVIHISERVKDRLQRCQRSTRDARLALRCQIILHASARHSSWSIAEMVGCSRSWASRVIRRFREFGEAGLQDRREDNGTVKVDDDYLGQLHRIVSQTPGDFGYGRPTWTRESLVKVMSTLTDITIHPTTMSRALKAINARRGRPKPTVACPWSEDAKNKRLRNIERLVAKIPAREVVLYEDEVDIHLNPKIGLDWMNRGEQKTVMTPGKNEKRYIAGALNVRTNELVCVEAETKTSTLFIALLHELRYRYTNAKKIHLILDNYRIHKSKITMAVLEHLGSKFVLHFLPPYCPDNNRIERVWLDLHSEVTRNHTCTTIEKLMRNVWRFIERRSVLQLSPSRRRAA